MGGEILGAQRILVAKQGEEIVGPPADVGLTHAELDLHIEEVSQGEHLYRSGIDAAYRQGSAAPDRRHTLAQGICPIKLDLGRLEDRADQRARRLHTDGIDCSVYAPTVGHLEHELLHVVYHREVYRLHAVLR